MAEDEWRRHQIRSLIEGNRDGEVVRVGVPEQSGPGDHLIEEEKLSVVSRIDLREGDGSEGSRKPAVEIDSLYPLADALAQGLEKATPHQEVAVMLTRRERRFGRVAA